MASKEDGKRSGEMKNGENDEDSDSSIVEELVSYLNSTDYNERISTFFHQHCADFHDYQTRQVSGLGNKLEWMNIHNEYLELVENELQSFCEMKQLDSQEIFLQIQRFIEKNGEGEFIPMFLKTTDENYFFEQMYSLANESILMNHVEEISANEGKGDESFTSIWHTDPMKFNEVELSDWLVALGVPWVFRKLVLRSQRSSNKVMIAHIPREQFEISTILPIFGSWIISVSLNGKWQSGSNRFGDPIRVSGRETADGAVHIQLKNTKTGCLTVFTISSREEHLVMYRELFLSGEEQQSPDAILHTYLLR
jgi:hypothetical protein